MKYTFLHTTHRHNAPQLRKSGIPEKFSQTTKQKNLPYEKIQIIPSLNQITAMYVF